jgi:hypothetical protein
MGRNTVDPCIGAAGSFEPGLLYTKPSTPTPRTRVGGAAPAEARGEFLAPNSPLVLVCAPWCWLCGAPPAAAVTSRRCPVKKTALNRPTPDPVPDIAADLLIAEHLLQEARG